MSSRETARAEIETAAWVEGETLLIRVNRRYRYGEKANQKGQRAQAVHWLNPALLKLNLNHLALCGRAWAWLFDQAAQVVLAEPRACGWVMGAVAGGHAVGEAVYAALVYSVAEELRIPVWEAGEAVSSVVE